MITYDGYDKARVKTRDKKPTRPRTKIRPKYENAKDYIVIGIDRGRYKLVSFYNNTPAIIAVKAKQLPRKSIVIGDKVAATGDLSGKKDTLARIVKIHERTNQLMRSSDEKNREKVIVANASTMVIVVALSNPEPKIGMIDRCLVAAYNANMKPILCLTKSDLAPCDELIDFYKPLGIEIYVTSKHDNNVNGIDCIQKRLAKEISVFIGHSGVGKSTLINALIPDANRDTGCVNSVTGKGRHTSTSTVAFAMPNGGWVIDTPGVRAFGLAHLSVKNVIGAFDDLSEMIENCPKGCKHTVNEDSCFLNNNEIVLDEKIQKRIASLRRILSTKDS